MCAGDFTNWPLDYQNCSLIFGHLSITGQEINYETNRVRITTKNNQENTQWKLLSATVEVDSGNYSMDNKTYPSIMYTFMIERHSALHIAGYFASAIGK